MQEILDFIQTYPWSKKLIWTIVLLIITIFLTNFINHIIFNKISEPNKTYMARKRTYYIFTIIYLIVVFFLWIDAANSFTTYIGLLSAGIAIALKDIFSNLAAWLFIVIRKPFMVGDRILINGQRGDIIDIRIFQFSLIELSEPIDGEQSTGRIIDIPNHYVFHYPVVNYVKGFNYVWNEIQVEITFESDWKKAKKEFEKIVNHHAIHLSEEAEYQIKEASKKFMIYYNNLTPIVYTDVRASGVLLTLRYLCNPKHKRNTINNIWEEILDLVNNNDDIDLAYPTRRVINNS